MWLISEPFTSRMVEKLREYRILHLGVTFTQPFDRVDVKSNMNSLSLLSCCLKGGVDGDEDTRRGQDL